jgi:glycosyltransferase involved in cell wall biosynthesis
LLNVYSDQRSRANVLRAVVGVVVASGYMRQVYVQNGVDERVVRVLPPPVNLEPDAALQAAPATPRRVLFLGRFTSGKGAVRAIQATARCQRSIRDRQLVLTMAGDGPELDRCRRLAIRLGVQTEFPGWVGAERRLELLRNADVLVVPSQWPEPFGMVGVEAGCVGVPAVAYRAGGIVDWLRPGVSGELAEGFGPRSLAQALERALGDPEHYQRLRLGAWQTAHEFGGNQHISRLETFFEGLLRKEAS